MLFVDRCDRHQHSRTWISRQWFFRAYASSCFSVRAPRLLAVPSNQTWRTLGVASYSRTNFSPLRSCGCDGGPACPAFRIFSSCDAPLTPPRFSPVPSAQLPAFQLEVRARCQPRSWPTFRPYAQDCRITIGFDRRHQDLFLRVEESRTFSTPMR